MLCQLELRAKGALKQGKDRYPCPAQSLVVLVPQGDDQDRN